MARIDWDTARARLASLKDEDPAIDYSTVLDGIERARQSGSLDIPFLEAMGEEGISIDWVLFGYGQHWHKGRRFP